MTSAMHNIEGPTGISGGLDHHDGVGGIDVDLADFTTSLRGGRGSPTGSGVACTGPCWWAETIRSCTPSRTDPCSDGFNDSGYRFYTFNARAGDRIRFGINWSSHVDCPSTTNCRSDELLTDLNVALFDPDRIMIAGSESASLDNNYEIAPTDGSGGDGALILNKSGEYRIGVTYRIFGDISPDIGVAWTRTQPYVNYLPRIIHPNYAQVVESPSTVPDGSTTNTYPVPNFPGSTAPGGSATNPPSTPVPNSAYPPPPTATVPPPTSIPPTPLPSPTSGPKSGGEPCTCDPVN